MGLTNFGSEVTGLDRSQPVVDPADEPRGTGINATAIGATTSTASSALYASPSRLGRRNC